ncbi:MAG: hypothetical protein RLZZ502_1451 [Pseudomonadota bacterium]
MNHHTLEQLAHYVNGTLAKPEREALEQRLNSEPDLVKQRDFYQAIANQLHADAPSIAPDLGLNQVLARITQDSKDLHKAKARAQKTVATKSWFTQWFGSWLSPSRPVYAFALALIVVQMGVIGGLFLNDTPYTETRASKSAPVVAGPFIKVSFKPDSKEADLRFLLVGLGASIVGGPSQLGDYYLYMAIERTDWAAAQLKQSPIVEQVNVIATLPAQE